MPGVPLGFPAPWDVCLRGAECSRTLSSLGDASNGVRGRGMLLPPGQGMSQMEHIPLGMVLGWDLGTRLYTAPSIARGAGPAANQQVPGATQGFPVPPPKKSHQTAPTVPKPPSPATSSWEKFSFWAGSAKQREEQDRARPRCPPPCEPALAGAIAAAPGTMAEPGTPGWAAGSGHGAAAGGWMDGGREGWMEGWRMREGAQLCLVLSLN